ncbi:MAG: hypothetical protein M1840_000896 [Geoglossum simile]|nr:MAG: hypothetical protein M1840_000896 [Geoglossum simile]
MESLVEVSEIPTVTHLYKAGRIRRISSESHSVIARPEFNNKVGHIRADITKLHVDAIVNVAEPRLRRCGHVDSEIHRVAGPLLRKKCKSLDWCLTGEARITDGYNLPAKKVIHAVGPLFECFRTSEAWKYLHRCYLNCLALAVENDCKTVAFPALGAGIYGFPIDMAAKIAVRAVRDFIITRAARKVDMVIFCTYNEKNFLVYEEIIP